MPPRSRALSVIPSQPPSLLTAPQAQTQMVCQSSMPMVSVPIPQTIQQLTINQVLHTLGKHSQEKKQRKYLTKNRQTGLTSSNGTQTNITFAIDRSSTSLPWPITANSTSVTFNQTLDLYIVPTNGSFTQVGFSTNTSVPTGGVTTGFGWYGKSVAYAASDSDYQLRFWATNTTTTGVFALYWNANTVATDTPVGAFPVAIKSTPPASV